MEQLFAFPRNRTAMDLFQNFGLVTIPSLRPNRNPNPISIPRPTASPAEYSLNPNAVEFVPSYLLGRTQAQESSGAESKTEATSTTTLVTSPEIVGDAVDHAENGFHVQRQIFEILSQLGDEQMPLEEIAVGLLPGGRGLSMKFTPKPNGQSSDLNDSIIQDNHSLRLGVGQPQSLASRPETVLVSQFLIRVNDMLSEKFEYAGDASVCPKCTLRLKRSYTEMEIEQQIEGIKAFENFFTFTEATHFQDLVNHKAFKELCHRLGLIVSCDKIQVNGERSGEMSSALNLPPPPPPSNQGSDVTICTSSGVGTDLEGDGEAYAGDDESQSNGDEITPRGSASRVSRTEYVRGKLYRYDNSEGSQLVNQLTEGDSQNVEPMQIDDFCTGPQATSSAKSKAGTSTFPRLYKSAKAKCSARGTGTIVKQSAGHAARRVTGYHASSLPNPQTTGSNALRMRSTIGQSALTIGGARSLPSEPCPLGAARKRGAGTVLPVYQKAEALTGTAAGRITRSGRPATSAPRPTSNFLKTSKGATGSRIGGSSSKQAHGASQRMIPRSTNASLMRQTEVKRRMSLMRGDSDTDLLYNVYLFK